jgi:hypothetical protein
MLYDFRLFNRKGALILLYQAVCDSESQALAKLPTLKAIPHSRLEMWRGDSLLLSNDRAETDRTVGAEARTEPRGG